MLTFQVFATPTVLASGYTDALDREDTVASLSYLPRLPAASHDFLLSPTTFCCSSCDRLEKYLRHLALGCFYGVVTA